MLAIESIVNSAYTHMLVRTTICEKNEMFTFVNMLCQLQADTNEMLVENVRRRQF